MRPKRAVLFLVLALLSAQPSRAGVSLHQTLEQAIVVFSDLRNIFDTLIVEPAARDQSVRFLRRLSNRLEALALAKEDFTHEVMVSSWPADQPRLQRSALDLEQQVREVRVSLQLFFEPLPPSWQSRGSAIHQNLALNLSYKWARFADLAKELQLPDSNKDAIIKESKELSRLVLRLKGEVDGLITEISSKRTPAG